MAQIQFHSEDVLTLTRYSFSLYPRRYQDCLSGGHFRFNTISGTKPQILTPNRYKEYPHYVVMHATTLFTDDEFTTANETNNYVCSDVSSVYSNLPFSLLNLLMKVKFKIVLLFYIVFEPLV